MSVPLMRAPGHHESPCRSRRAKRAIGGRRRKVVRRYRTNIRANVPRQSKPKSCLGKSPGAAVAPALNFGSLIWNTPLTHSFSRQCWSSSPASSCGACHDRDVSDASRCLRCWNYRVSCRIGGSRTTPRIIAAGCLNSGRTNRPVAAWRVGRPFWPWRLWLGRRGSRTGRRSPDRRRDHRALLFIRLLWSGLLQLRASVLCLSIRLLVRSVILFLRLRAARLRAAPTLPVVSAKPATSSRERSRMSLGASGLLGITTRDHIAPSRARSRASSPAHPPA
jgi:hypothetical protein